MEEMTREAGGRVGQALHDARDRGAQILGTMKEKVAHGAETLGKKSFNELSNDAKSYVKNNPGKLILASFVAGIVLGAIVRGRNNRT